MFGYLDHVSVASELARDLVADGWFHLPVLISGVESAATVAALKNRQGVRLIA
jgi:hypothetical protein